MKGKENGGGGMPSMSVCGKKRILFDGRKTKFEKGERRGKEYHSGGEQNTPFWRKVTGMDRKPEKDRQLLIETYKGFRKKESERHEL